jgi:hypothetical protein
MRVWRVLIVAIATLALAGGAWADTFDVSMDFEGPEWNYGPLDGLAPVTFSGTYGSFSVAISMNGPESLGFTADLVDLSVFAGSGVPPTWGTRTLSNFSKPDFIQPILLDFDVTGLLPGYQINQVSWESGDFVPSDVDSYSIGVYNEADALEFSSTIGTGPLGPTIIGDFGLVTPDPAGYGPNQPVNIAESSFGMGMLSLLFGGQDFPSSGYFDNFSIRVTNEIAGTDLPLSGPGGDPIGGGLPGDTPIPEPGTFVLMGLGVAGLAAARFRRRRD